MIRRCERLLRGAAARLSMRTVAVMAAVTLGLHAQSTVSWAAVSGADSVSMGLQVSVAIVNAVTVLVVTIGTLLADELVDQGAPRLATYGAAVVTGTAIGALIQWAVHAALHVSPLHPMNVVGNAALHVQPLVVFFEQLTWATVLVGTYVNLRGAMQAAARASAARTGRARIEQRAVEARLLALRTRVEPQRLLDDLRNIRDLYDLDPASGASALDDLITTLRAALRQTVVHP